MYRSTFRVYTLGISPLLKIRNRPRERYRLWGESTKICAEVSYKTLSITLTTIYNNVEDFFELIPDRHRSTRLYCLDTHHLQFWFCVLDTLIIMYVEDVSFLSYPDTLVRDYLTTHLHSVLIRTSHVSHLLIRLSQNRFKMIPTNVI